MSLVGSKPGFENNSQGVWRFRDYLLLLARMNLGEKYQAKLDPSDIVQQTLLEAHKGQPHFRGTTEGELACWLREILATTMAKAFRDLGRAKRDVSREQTLNDLNASSARLEAWMVASQPSPSQRIHDQERVVQIAAALGQLPDGQREAMMLKHCQGWTLTQIAQHMGSSPPAVVGLLKRGARRLRSLLGGEEEVEGPV